MNTTELEDAVLHLSIERRAYLAEKLLESLAQPSESEMQQMWLREADRRAQEIDEGRVNLISSEELEQKIQAILR
jgi:putative addiction module component (TIGR02574 family)